MNLYGYEFQRESDLMHYGVLGMRWGIRKNPEKTYYKAASKYSKLKKKNINILLKQIRDYLIECIKVLKIKNILLKHTKDV